QTVHHSTLVGANVYLHPEVPRIPFLCLLHLRVAALLPVLRRAWRRDDRRIHDRSRTEQQSLGFQQGIDLGDHRFGHVVLLERVPESRSEERRVGKECGGGGWSYLS